MAILQNGCQIHLAQIEIVYLKRKKIVVQPNRKPCLEEKAPEHVTIGAIIVINVPIFRWTDVCLYTP